MEVKKNLVSVSALFLLAFILTSISSTTVKKNYCDESKCAYCEASTSDSTYKSCKECVNSKSVLVNTSTDCGLSSCVSLPNDVYYCSGSITVANCLIEYNESETANSGCRFCKQGYKKNGSTSGSITTYTCESHTTDNCIAWDYTNNRCEACDENYKMTNSYACS